MFTKEDMIEDPCTDEAGQLMNAMHKIQTWTKSIQAMRHKVMLIKRELI